MKKQLRTLLLLSILFYSVIASSQGKPNHALWDQVLILNVSEHGKVNYKGVMHDSSLMYKYFTSLSENPPQESWTKEEKLAYWMNVYNAITIKLVINNYPVKTIKDIEKTWSFKFFKIGDKKYSLDDVEHGILRKMKEPRIHFLINCAATSCPPLWNRAFTAENVNKALEERTKKFLNNPKYNIITKDAMQISKVFMWYKKDFTDNGANLEDFINRYSSIKVTSKTKKSFKEYNWSLNE